MTDPNKMDGDSKAFCTCFFIFFCFLSFLVFTVKSCSDERTELLNFQKEAEVRGHGEITEEKVLPNGYLKQEFKWNDERDKDAKTETE